MDASHVSTKLSTLEPEELRKVDEALKKIKTNEAATYVQQPNSAIFFRVPIITMRQEVQKLIHKPKN